MNYTNRRGVRHYRHKLTEEQVREIYLSPNYMTDLAKEYGVMPSTIHCIKSGKHWRHVTDHLTAPPRQRIGRPYGPSVDKLEEQVAEWKQIAQIEASARREFHNKALALEAMLKKARQYINDWGPDTPGKMAAMNNDMLELIDRVLARERKVHEIQSEEP